MTDAPIRIGASDVARLMRGDWYVLYREKMGLQPKKPFADTIHSQLGVLTEDFHRQILSDAMRGHESHDWTISEGGLAECKSFGTDACAQAVAQIDAWAEITTNDITDRQAPVELKFPHHSRWFDDRLEAYYPQLQWQMMVTAATKVCFSCLWIDRHEWRWIGRDQRYINLLFDTAQEFVWHLERQLPPKRTLGL